MASSSYHNCYKQSTTLWRSDAVPSTIASLHVADESNLSMWFDRSLPLETLQRQTTVTRRLMSRRHLRPDRDQDTEVAWSVGAATISTHTTANERTLLRRSEGVFDGGNSRPGKGDEAVDSVASPSCRRRPRRSATSELSEGDPRRLNSLRLRQSFIKLPKYQIRLSTTYIQLSSSSTSRKFLMLICCFKVGMCMRLIVLFLYLTCEQICFKICRVTLCYHMTF